MKKVMKWSLGFVVLAAVALQFFNPALTNPPVQPGRDLMATNAPPPEVAALLHGACYDCHSSETKWPWYSHIAPVSMYLMKHINEGREAMNFSDWPHDDAQSRRDMLVNIRRQVERGRMPLPSYTWIHRASRLTEAQRKVLTDWASKSAEALRD